ncbi:molecular chaperone TorD family protein [Desulfocurvibacter africanus]|uniref:molecular chaperone TorD family protein n=1 Tax=Desulfocurvibacter africanus TaxID=873 RepID=UPI001ED95886|nr:molecular chaperone TorD family protein [Desulfocurvibacter africanus]
MNSEYTASASRPDQACTPDAVRIDVLDLCAEIFQGPDLESFPALLGQELPDLARRTADCGSPLAEPLAFLIQVSPCMASSNDINASLADLESAYVSLFINARGGIQAPLYESCHTPNGGRLMGPPAEAMSERLVQAGLTLVDGLAEPPDHLSIELEYLAFLLTEALDEDNPALATLARDFALQVLPAWRRWADTLESVIPAEPDTTRASTDGSIGRTPEAFFRAAARLTLAALNPVSD